MVGLVHTNQRSVIGVNEIVISTDFVHSQAGN